MLLFDPVIYDAAYIFITVFLIPHSVTDKSCFVAENQLIGCKIQKVYTSLGTLYHNVYTRFQSLLAPAYMHFP